MNGFNPVSLIVLTVALSVVPLLMVVGTAFLKISTILMLLRNALGVQQIPPNIAMYGLALVLSLYVMAPVVDGMQQAVEKQSGSITNVSTLFETAREASTPLREFMMKHSRPHQRQFFLDAAHKMWPAHQARAATESDFLILLPAFVCSELTAAFEIGLLLFLPFVVIDLIVSNILLALGMMMVSPATISLPLKLFLFVMLDGWTRLLHGLVLSYAS